MHNSCHILFNHFEDETIAFVTHEGSSSSSSHLQTPVAYIESPDILLHILKRTAAVCASHQSRYLISNWM